MPKNNVYGGFSQALFFSGSVSIPRLLLDHYHDLGISDREMMLVIHILTETTEKKDEKDIPNSITKKMGISSPEFNNLIQSLQSKGLITINADDKNKKNHHNSYYDLGGLIDQLFELWGINQFKQIEKSGNMEIDSKLIAVFEEELGRPLTGFECEHLEKWLLASYSEGLIIEALRRGVSAGIRNFRYLDSILREWEKKGIRTVMEVEAEDQNFQARQTKKGDRQVKPKNTKNKYDDIYI